MKRKIEFDEPTHTYFVDGLVVPSVTQVLRAKFNKKYNNIPPAVLNKAASRGTKIHKAIEDFVKLGIDDGSEELANFNFLAKHYGYTPEASEIPVAIEVDGEVVCAGRLDLILRMPTTLAVADIKTTSTLDKEYLGYQLNLYRIGVQQMYGEDIGELYGIHLRGDKRKFVKIPVNEDMAYSILDEYKDWREE